MNGFSKLLTGAAIGALMIGSANAADILGNGSLKDDAPAGGGGVVNWSGFYIGGALGYSNTNHDLSVQEYFKDFCYNADDVATEGFDAWLVDRDHTVAKHNKEHIHPSNDPTNDRFRTSCEKRVGDPDGDGPKTTESGDATVGGQSREVLGLDGLSSSGLTGDVRIGYDRAMGRWVGGVFASYGFGNQSTSLRAATLDIDAIEKGDSWSAGARLGYIVAPRTLVYALAAYTETDYSFSGVKMLEGSFVGGSKDVTFAGITVGGGIEFALAANIFFGLEGTHTFYGEETIADSYN